LRAIHAPGRARIVSAFPPCRRALSEQPERIDFEGASKLSLLATKLFLLASKLSLLTSKLSLLATKLSLLTRKLSLLATKLFLVVWTCDRQRLFDRML
jgi:hypothetical protein